MAKAETTNALLEDTVVVDTDVHVAYEPEVKRDIARRLDQPYRGRIDPDSSHFIPPIPMAGHSIDIPDKLEGKNGPTADADDIQRALCDEFGVDHPILNKLPLWDLYPDTEQIYREMEATNDVLIERYLDPNGDFFGLMSVPMRDPERAAEEIDRLGDEDQIVGVLIHAGGQERGPGDPRYDPLYNAAQSNGLTIAYHSTGTGLMWTASEMIRGLATFLEVHTITHAFAMMWTMTSLIFNGVPEKFPDLKFAMLESGIGWIPFMMGRMNREYGQRRSEAPLLQKSPEEYVKENFYFGTQPLAEPNDMRDLEGVIETIGVDNLMFASDYPHFDFDNPSTAQKYVKLLTSDERDKVFRENAAEAFELPV